MRNFKILISFFVSISVFLTSIPSFDVITLADNFGYRVVRTGTAASLPSKLTLPNGTTINIWEKLSKRPITGTKSNGDGYFYFRSRYGTMGSVYDGIMPDSGELDLTKIKSFWNLEIDQNTGEGKLICMSQHGFQYLLLTKKDVNKLMEAPDETADQIIKRWLTPKFKFQASVNNGNIYIQGINKAGDFFEKSVDNTNIDLLLTSLEEQDKAYIKAQIKALNTYATNNPDNHPLVAIELQEFLKTALRTDIINEIEAELKKGPVTEERIAEIEKESIEEAKKMLLSLSSKEQKLTVGIFKKLFGVENLKLNEIPQRLKKWLSEKRDSLRRYAQPLTNNSLLDLYFKPKSWESRKIYEALGVKYFMKFYFCSLGLIAKPSPLSVSEETLKQRKKVSRQLEAMHLVMAIPYLPFIAFAFFNRDYLLGVGFPAMAVELIINIYPIMTQRYIRGRLNKILERKQARENE